MTKPVRVLFVHHSVGRGILTHGQVRRWLQQLGDLAAPELFDHDYNRRGLTGPAGNRLGRAFPIPDDNTDPPGLRTLFETARNDASLRAELQSYGLVVVKSCFPNSRVESDEALDTLKDTYRAMIAVAGELEIPLAMATTPPVRIGRIEPDAAARAAEVAGWLTAREGLVAVFDLFGMLADVDPGSDTYGMLRKANTNPFLVDSHPTRAASQAIGRPFAEFLLSAAKLAEARKG